MICVRELQRSAGRAGAIVARLYPVEGNTHRVLHFRELERRKLREIEQRFGHKACACSRCTERAQETL